MFANFLNSLSENIALLSSVIGIAAVTICSILTSIITQSGSRKMAQTELFFHEKVDAYYDFMLKSSNYFNKSDQDATEAFARAYTRALLFSSQSTRKEIINYRKDLEEAILFSPLQLHDIARLEEKRLDLIACFQKDIAK